MMKRFYVVAVVLAIIIAVALVNARATVPVCLAVAACILVVAAVTVVRYALLLMRLRAALIDTAAGGIQAGDQVREDHA